MGYGSPRFYSTIKFNSLKTNLVKYAEEKSCIDETLRDLQDGTYRKADLEDLYLLKKFSIQSRRNRDFSSAISTVTFQMS